MKDYQNYKELRIDGGLYKGQLDSKGSNGRHGKGTMEYSDYSVYTGDWFKNKR